MLNLLKMRRSGPACPMVPGGGARGLRVYVLMTEVAATLGAVRTASQYTGGLCPDVEIIVPRVIPYPLPLNKPPVHSGFLESKLAALFADVTRPATVRIVLCRDRLEGIKSSLPERSIVVIGLARRWWGWRERILSRRLRAMGYETLLSSCAQSAAAMKPSPLSVQERRSNLPVSSRL